MRFVVEFSAQAKHIAARIAGASPTLFVIISRSMLYVSQFSFVRFYFRFVTINIS